MNGIKILTQPAAEPVSLAEAKMHLRIDTSPPTSHPDDLLIENMIKAARRWAEGFQNRVYVTQSWVLSMAIFPHAKYIEFPRAPLQSLISMAYYDGTLHTVSFLDPSGTPLSETDDYIVDVESDPGRLCLKSGKSWPTVTRQANAVQIQFIAGYGDPAYVPEDIKAAIMLKMTDLYENRGELDPGNYYERAAKSLLGTDRSIPI